MQNTSNPVYDYRAKIIVLGSTNIGKTAMIKGYCTNQYSQGPENATIGIDFQMKKVVVNEKVIRLQIWDSAGVLDIDRHRKVTFSYFKGVNGVILAYSILERDTFLYLERILKALEDEGFGEIPKILVGTGIELDEYDPSKEDQELRRVVSYDEAEEFAEKNGMLYFEVSPRNGKNIQQPFEGLVEILVEEWESKKKAKYFKRIFHASKSRKCRG